LMVIGIVFLSVLAAGIVSIARPKMYESYATFLPLVIDSPRGSRITNTQALIISILESRRLADKVIRKKSLIEKLDAETAAEARRTLVRQTDVFVEGRGIIKVSVLSESAETAAKAARAYVENFTDLMEEMGFGQIKDMLVVVDSPGIPEEPLPRNTIVHVLLAGVLSFLFSIFLICVLEFFKGFYAKARP
ncbi:MAG: hypothetical protein ACLFPX_08205, partial [Candidatus Omnitrophota bacterium]